MTKTFAILRSVSCGVNTALYLFENADPAKVMGIWYKPWTLK